MVRARFRDAFAELCPKADVPRHVWQIPWVVHITPWRQGEQAVLHYLARYVFRIAITDRRILAVGADTVTFRYNDRTADRQRTETVSGHEFLRRFLQHVLPAGFHKVRYYGLWHAARRDHVRNLRNALLLDQPATAPATQSDDDPPNHSHATGLDLSPQPRPCPHCQGHLRLLCRLSHRRGPEDHDELVAHPADPSSIARLLVRTTARGWRLANAPQNPPSPPARLACHHANHHVDHGEPNPEPRRRLTGDFPSLPAQVEIPIERFFSYSENTRPHASVQPSLRARKGHANESEFACPLRARRLS